MRSRHDRKIAGVAGGLGRYTGIDPLVFRIVFVVLAVFGGSGLLLYALAWLFVPEEGQVQSEAHRVARGSGTLGTVVAIAAAAAGLFIFGHAVGTGPGFSGLVLLVAVAVGVYLALRPDRAAGGIAAGPNAQTAQPAGATMTTGAHGSYGQTAGTAYGGASAFAAPTASYADTSTPPPYYPPAAPVDPAGSPSPRAARRSRQRSLLGRVTVSTALVVVGLLLAYRVADGFELPFPVVPAAALVVVGLGLLVGALVGRSRGLIVLGLALVAMTIAAAAIFDVAGTNSVGAPEWRPRNIADVQPAYRLGVGNATLDLSAISVPPGERVTITAVVAAGNLRVVVPPEPALEVDMNSSRGELALSNGRRGTVDRREVITYPGRSGFGTLRLNLRVGEGFVGVEHAAS